jgi:outer membrane protein
MKSLFIAVIAAMLGAVFSFAAVGHAQTSKAPSAVAVVSPSRVYTETTHGRTEAGRLQTMQQQRTADLRTKQQALEATRQQLVSATDAGARAQFAQAELQQRVEFERATQQAQADVQALQREINTDLQQRVRAVLDDLLKTQGYQLVLNSDATVMWSDPALDLTSAVVGRMNGQQ